VTKDELIAFETRVAELWEAGELPYLIHLSGGNEDQLISIFEQVKPGDWVFSTHRNHYHALLAGVPPEKLMKLIRQGDSMFVFDREHNFLTSAILAGNCCIAAGVAWMLKEEGSPNKVWCFLGDGAEENGHFAEAVTMVSSHKLPCTFIIEDNDRASNMSRDERRPNKFYMQWDETWSGVVQRWLYTPTYPHAGSGFAGHITFKDRR